MRAEVDSTLWPVPADSPSGPDLLAVSLVSATLLMIELALTRIFSVIMYYHFAFLAISIALFGLSASGVFVFVARAKLDRYHTRALLAWQAVLYAAATVVALFFLVRLRVGLNYSPRNLELMLAIYALAAIPFFTGGLVLTMAVSRFASRINSVYAADLTGAAAGCLVLIPLLDRLGAPGVVLSAAALALLAAILFAPPTERRRLATIAAAVFAVPIAGQATGVGTFDVTDTKGHQGDRVLFSKWNSFSRIGVYGRTHGDWSLSAVYTGPVPDSRFMDIDSAASTPILYTTPALDGLDYLRYELTAVAYQLKRPDDPFTALVIGPGGGRDLASALVFGASHVDAVEINPIIANDVMRGRFLEFSGRIYEHPRVSVVVDDGRSFVRRTTNRYDVIQASLVDTWAATAAGAYTLTENTLYTAEAFGDYLDHLNDDGVLTITRWTFDGLRLVSLAQEACARRGWNASGRLAIVKHDRIATFLFKKSPLTKDEVNTLRDVANRLQFTVLYAPSIRPAEDNEYARLVLASDRHAFYSAYPEDIRPTTDDRPFFFHTTKLRDQFEVAFGRSMLFGNGLSALLTLMGISFAVVLLFIIGPLLLVHPWGQDGVGPVALPHRWLAWLVYFGALGAGFMLLEVSLLQRFVLLLGHPVYSLTVTLFCLLLGTGIGAMWSRRFDDSDLRRVASTALIVIVILTVFSVIAVAPLVRWAIPFSRAVRIAIAAAVLLPTGLALGIPMPAGVRLLSRTAPEMVPWAWGMNGALSVVGATVAIFIAMNWGFGVTQLSAAAAYLIGLAAATRAA